jgi:hypothetical protein
VLKEQYITVAIKVNGVVTERLKLRRILFKTDEGKLYAYATNNFTLPASQIATIIRLGERPTMHRLLLRRNNPGELPLILKPLLFCLQSASTKGCAQF